jgi:hypothetical protein
VFRVNKIGERIKLNNKKRKLVASEYWTWNQTKETILTLKNRLGFDEKIWILGFEVSDEGIIYDPFHKIQVFDPKKEPNPRTIPYSYNAIPEIYCLLSKYASAAECSNPNTVLSSPNSMLPFKRLELEDSTCKLLLKFDREKIDKLRTLYTSFFGRVLNHGDCSFEVFPLPNVPVTIVLWVGDEETGSGGSLLYYESISNYLSGLELEIVSLTVWRLTNILDQNNRWGYYQLVE